MSPRTYTQHPQVSTGHTAATTMTTTIIIPTVTCRHAALIAPINTVTVAIITAILTG